MSTGIIALQADAFRGQAPSRFPRYAQSRVSVCLLFPQESPPSAPLKYFISQKNNDENANYEIVSI